MHRLRPHLKKYEVRSERRDSPTRPWAIWLAWVGFTIYGSLVPFDFRPLPIDQAWERFASAGLLQIGLFGRADWIANGLLYVPVGLLSVMILSEGRLGRPPAAVLSLALGFAATLAFVIEYLQIYFPPRTVALNDPLAEIIGALIGIIVAARWPAFPHKILSPLSAPARQLTRRTCELYAIAYLGYCLFPFDLILDSHELDWKLNSGSLGWLLSDNTRQSAAAMVIAKLVFEVIAAVPLGYLIGSVTSGRGGTLRAILAGGSIGLIIEALQFFTVTGISQGASLITRAIGVLIGTLLWRSPAVFDARDLQSSAKRWLPILALGYIFMLALLNGWLTNRWSNIATAKIALGQVEFLPLYYHYFTSETIALPSLLLAIAIYAPAGVLVWLVAERAGARWAAVLGFALAATMEAGKLFFQNTHPDPTNAWVAAISAWAAFKFSARLSATSADRPLDSPKPIAAYEPFVMDSSATKVSGAAPSVGGKAPAVADASGRSPTPGSRRGPSGAIVPVRSHPATIVLVALSMTAALIGAIRFPYQSELLVLLLVLVAVVVWHRPQLSLLIAPAALPILDLAPWSGRFFYNEFDFLVIVCAGVGLARTQPATRRPSEPDPLLKFVLALVALSVFIGIGRALWPWQSIDDNSFSNYFSPFNGLRIARGAIWAYVFMALASRFQRHGVEAPRLFSAGLVVGLAGAIGMIIIERLRFSGLFNFSSDFRITGPFSQMHTGGAQVECFLTLAMPFVVMHLLQSKNFILRLILFIGLLLTTYSLMVTFSRGGYAGYALAFLIVFASSLIESGRRMRTPPLKRLIGVVVLFGMVLAVALPISFGEFAQQRIANIESDLSIREKHWTEVLEVRDSDWASAIFGMGIGRFPETNFWRNENDRTATYKLATGNDEKYLTLGAGENLYIEQFVAAQPNQRHRMAIKARSHSPRARVTLSLCEKSLLASFRCAHRTFSIPSDGDWHALNSETSSGSVGSGPLYSARPVKLTLYVSGRGATIDVDDISLRSAEGEELVANGGFEAQLDHWYFSTGNHLPWHAKNMPLAVLFDQGWFGAMSIGAFVLLGLVRAGRKAWHGDLVAGSYLAAIAGTLTIGLFDTIIDAPRFLFLLLMLLYLSSMRQYASPLKAQDQRFHSNTRLRSASEATRLAERGLK